MIPTGGAITNKQIVEVQRPSRTYRIDLKKGRIIGWTDGLEAVKQAVYKILNTERFRHLIYDSDYGFEFANLIGRDPLFVKSELRRRITEALTQDDRINSVSDFQLDISGDTAVVRFTVATSFGSFQEEVTVSV